ncbi:hypothetical protein CORC01_02626 [Colletotrichum orchidophilum]|uniref:Tyrosinase copper-binding domain-containing protein n=1 Tax=Colletotrichum orchidophilum TaxID=1209926 RepID=A0A1G4BL74_9PEZI|nr:uncharacterized protein CORC01_02626 [Colletotrichum orchidophilum]OHF02047.1 hypothetical protein CORC01_02626 [Colletotrichum orchidophilum]
MRGFLTTAGCLASLAALVSETIALPVQDAPLRVEWRTLSSAAKADYISAVKCLDGLPSKIGLETSLYNDFPYVHALLNNEIHFVAQFLPWHRYFVYVYEKALRDECKYTGPMTYWDWTLDSDDMSKSPVFSNDTTSGLGGNGLNGGWVAPTRPNPLTMCVLDGAFANFTVSYYTTNALSHCLNRGFNDGVGVNAGRYQGGLYSPAKVSGIVENSGNFSTFATALENGPHGAIHSAVGGDLFPSTSPNATLISDFGNYPPRNRNIKMICSPCHLVLGAQKDYALVSSKINGENPLEPHHRDCGSLTASVDAGCYICNRLWATLDTDERQKVRQSSIEPAGQESADFVNSTLTSVFLDDGAAFAYPSALLLQIAFDRSKVVQLERNPSKGFMRASILLLPQDSYAPQYKIASHSHTTRSDSTFHVAQKWIAECLAEHSHCGAKASTITQWCPSRLLDTGPLDQESFSCRLVLPNITPIQGPYTTLSHCWGITESFNLTLNNYAQLLQDIPLDTLPQLFRDAVEITRRLNIRYLWIDSLCIIQQGDDLADWRHESTHMDKIYSRSFCNIAAADAPDAHYSMFCSRNPDAQCAQTLYLPVGSQSTRFLVLDYNLWRTEVSNAVINTRAWVLQERLLSPRVLYFGQRQILWECQQKEAAEIYPEAMLIDLSRFPSRFKGFSYNQIGWKPQGHGDLSKYQYWCNIVNAYTRAKLTFPGDKLIALSAVAKTARDLLGDDYVAGMWRRYLERELMWSVAVGQTQARPSVYRAPSWSWAAVDGHVTPGIMDIEAVEMLIEVQNLHLDYVTSDTTGLVSGGWLQLWGVLKKLELLPDISLSSHDNNHDFLKMVVNGVPVSVRADSVMKEYQPHVALDTSQEWTGMQNLQPDLFCMPARKRPDDHGSIYVLLLELQDRKEGVFRRVGIARGWGKDVRANFLARNGEEETLPCVTYKHGRHLVRII